MNITTIYNTSYYGDLEQCGYSEQCGTIRFIYIMLGTIAAIIGLIFNLLLIIAFSRQSKIGMPPTLYPTVLALFDLLICLFYILLFGVDAIAVCLHDEVRKKRLLITSENNVIHSS